MGQLYIINRFHDEDNDCSIRYRALGVLLSKHRPIYAIVSICTLIKEHQNV
jgi:hypothetical protein